MSHINNFFLKEPVWRDANRCLLGGVPPGLASWLLEPNSLTQRLKNSFSAPFSVRLAGQGLAKPFLADARQLKQRQQCHALIREVRLEVGDKPFVFARSTLSQKTAHALNELTHLGNKPLGEVIFAYPDLQRLSLDIAKINVNQLKKEVRESIGEQNFIWGRRNTYQINQHIFIVSEFFLPAMYQ